MNSVELAKRILAQIEARGCLEHDTYRLKNVCYQLVADLTEALERERCAAAAYDALDAQLQWALDELARKSEVRS